ncbi:heptaprenyl diphosphate synthase component 1 [Paenibacillus sanfengchensis]
MRPDRITELAQKYVEYDMITTHTELPNFPVPRVRLLYTFLKDSARLPERSGETCALAAFLVQLGLDTHDSIDVGDFRKEEKEMRSRQLKVLAGDYFSSVFYQQLAQEGLIGVISTLSAAICEVNRIKVRLYTGLRNMRISAEEYIKQRVRLKSELFHVFTEQLDKPAQNIWALLLTELSRCEVALDEMSPGPEAQEERKGYAYLRIWETCTAEDKEKLVRNGLETGEWRRLLQKYRIEKQLITMLHQSVENVKNLMHECREEHTRTEIGAILEPMMAVLSSRSPAIQEG